MLRIHIPKPGPKEFIFNPKHEYPSPQSESRFKPVGLWYGIGLAWQEWCESEQMGWVSGRYYEIDVGKSNLLVLHNIDEVVEFHKEYSANIFSDEEIAAAPVDIRKSLGFSYRYADWPRLRKEYDGIEIYEYCRMRWDLNLHIMWYSAWDCDSGCIWNLQDVTVRELTLKEIKRRLKSNQKS